MVREIGTFQKIINIIKYFIIMNVLCIIPIVLSDFEFNFIVAFVLMIIYLVLLYISVKYIYKQYIETFNFKTETLMIKDIMIDILLFLIMIGIGYIFMDVIFPAMGIDLSERILESNKLDISIAEKSWPCVLSYIIMAVVNAPIFEEIIFRGFLFHYFFDSKQYIIGGIVTTLIFALLHPYTSFPEFLFLFFNSFPLFIAYYRKFNIKDAILVHMINNMIATGIPILYYFFHK